MKRIVVIGAGFAGVWGALGAMRLLRMHNQQNEIEILVINKDAYHGIRPRYYEQDLSQVRIPLEKIFTPVGIRYHLGEVTHIDHDQQTIHVQNTAGSSEFFSYDRLLLASGSHLYAPTVPGLDQYAFNVDTYAAAEKLADHLGHLPSKPERGQFTIVVVGGGFTGVEVATELMDRLRKIAPATARVVIIDHSDIASTLGVEPQQVIRQALRDLNIETKPNARIKNIAQDHIELASGEIIETQTVVWTAGLRASNLTGLFSEKLDRFGRLSVDPFLRVGGQNHCFAAGNVACAMTDEMHAALLSCQHAMPQGRIAGHNMVADLLNVPMIPYEQKRFVVCVDLGSWGALYAEGWDQKIVEQGMAAKKIKNWINHERIYPVLNQGVDALLAAAAPVFKVIQTNTI